MSEPADHLDTQRLAFVAEHVVRLAHVPSTGRWQIALRGLALPIMGGSLEEAIDQAREFHGWAMANDGREEARSHGA